MFRLPHSVLLLFFGFTLLLPATGWARSVPNPAGYVTDTAGILTNGTERQLEARLEAFERSDSTQIAVLTIPSLEGDVPEAYALQVAEQWQIGQQGRDNGALLLISRDDRKIRIEVGYGLEGRLTDLLAGRIIDREMVPHFRRGDFDGGVTAGVSAMIEAVRGEYQAPPAKKKRRTNLGWLIALVIFLGPRFLLMGRPRYGHRHHRGSGIWFGGPFGGGGFGGGGGGFSGGFSGGGGGFGGGGASGSW